MADDEVGGGEVGLGVAVGNQVVMRPGLNLAGRRGGAEAGGAGRRHGGGAHQNHLIDRSLLDPGGEHIGGNDLIAGAGYQRRGLQHALLAFSLDLLLTLGQARGLLAHFIEGDLGIVGLHIGIRAINGDHGGLGDLGFQRGRYGIIRVKRDITRLQHVLDGGHVGFFAKYYARIAINLHRNERGVLVGAVDCATSGRTGCGRIGSGERSDGGNRLHIISMVETTPTYKRSKAVLESIQSRAVAEESSTPKLDNSENGSMTITF